MKKVYCDVCGNASDHMFEVAFDTKGKFFLNGGKATKIKKDVCYNCINNLGLLK